MKRGIVIAGGEVDAKVIDILKKRDSDLIAIGVDRGITFFLEHEIMGDYYLGDLDSINPSLISSIPKERLQQFPAEKNASDLELALDLCLKLQLESVEVYGATGTRWDHSFSNLLALVRYQQAGLHVILRNHKNMAQPLSSFVQLSVEEIQDFTYLSILPISTEGIAVSVHGVKYPLNHERLLFGKTRGVSNESIGQPVEIQLEEGAAILILSND